MIRVLRRLLPRRLYYVLRVLVMSTTTPSVYAARFGYFRSALRRTVTGREGQPVPWMTFPLVAFLETLPLADRSVLEFGSGASSAWWGERARCVVSLETDPAWLDRVRASVPSTVEVVEVVEHHADQDSFDAEVARVVGDRRFDVVVVDGGDRVKALHAAPGLLAPDGVIVVDDLDLYGEDPHWAAVLDEWRTRGLGRIDFYGLAIAAPFTRRNRCTSIFFPAGSFVLSAPRQAVTPS